MRCAPPEKAPARRCLTGFGNDLVRASWGGGIRCCQAEQTKHNWHHCGARAGAHAPQYFRRSLPSSCLWQRWPPFWPAPPSGASSAEVARLPRRTRPKQQRESFSFNVLAKNNKLRSAAAPPALLRPPPHRDPHFRTRRPRRDPEELERNEWSCKGSAEDHAKLNRR